ncbi:MAG: UDP binding domain-containing protein, partial [Woeseiaceae bacterium]
KISAYDPIATKEARRLFADFPIRYAASIEDAIHGVDGVIVITTWDEFAHLPQIISEMSPAPVLIDGRRMFDRRSVPVYEGIGLTS